MWKNTNKKQSSSKNVSTNLNFFSNLHEKELNRSMKIRNEELQEKIKEVEMKREAELADGTNSLPPKLPKKREWQKQKQLEEEYLKYKDYVKLK